MSMRLAAEQLRTVALGASHGNTIYTMTKLRSGDVGLTDRLIDVVAAPSLFLSRVTISSGQGKDRVGAQSKRIWRIVLV
jgi:hypothetical protein